jgi:phage-related protein (TIGR01555 family)
VEISSLSESRADWEYPMKKGSSKVPSKRNIAYTRQAISQDNGAADMYANPRANIGFGSTSSVNGGRYVPLRISLDYQELLNIYRGSWIARKIIDTIPEDMLKDFPKLECDLDPEDIGEFERVIARTRTLQKLIEAMKWGRLFGGALAIMILAGSAHRDLSQPLDLKTIAPGSYRGLIVVDRWSGVSPSNELVSDIDNPAEYGLPEYYQVTTEVGQNFRVHHSRVLRFIGRDLPLFEKQIQTYWGMSELECVHEDMKRYDYMLSGVADLIARAHVFVMKEPMMAQMLSGVGITETQYNDYVLRMKAVSESIGTNGIMALGKDAELFTNSYSFGGLADIGRVFMTQMCGAADYPMSRLFGQTNTGLGQSGEGDLQTYYDSIDQKRSRELRPIFDKLIPVICVSQFGEVPTDLDYAFPSIRSVTDEERADLADKTTKAIIDAFGADLLTKKQAVQTLARAGETHGLFQISDEDVARVPDKYASELGTGEVPPPPELAEEAGAKDSVPVEEFDLQGLSIAIETPKGTARNGPGWQVTMPADYGYINGVFGADGDELDCYVGPDHDSRKVFVVDQLTLDGKAFDEHKCMLGFTNAAAAEKAYRAGHHLSSKTFGAMTEVPMRKFAQWCDEGIVDKPVSWRRNA